MTSDGNLGLQKAVNDALVKTVNEVLERAALSVFSQTGVYDDKDRILYEAAERVRRYKIPVESENIS